LVLWRRRLLVSIIGTPVLAVTLWLGWSLGSPLFTNVTVEEAFPFARSAEVPADLERANVEEVMASMAKINQEVDETLSEGAGETSTQGMVMEEEDLTMLTKGLAMMQEAREQSDLGKMDEGLEMMAAAVDTLNSDAGPEGGSGEPVSLAAGHFMDADSFHKGSGLATIYRGPDGSHLLRLEELDVTNGPDLHVILTPFNNPERHRDVQVPGYVDLGQLKGNRGNQNYFIPDDVDVSSFQSVVIFCKPFSVIFSVAVLQDSSQG
jgi:hypothetical protein